MIYYRGRWLIEPEIKALLSKLEAENEGLRSEADRVLREKTVLREKQESAVRQIAEYKRLLKEAVEDIRYLINHAKRNGKACDRCKYGNEMYCYADDCSNDAKWQHEAEALALIGEDTNVPATEDDTNAGHKSGGWISYKDRLPSVNTLVLCYARSTTGEGNSYFLGALAHGEFWLLKVNDIGHVSCPVLHWEVTHWQPLPESPKED